jgi:hypothetical protein
MTKSAMAAKAHLWPKTITVPQTKNKVPEPRLWPRKRSAQTITQYMTDYGKKK